jgi:phage-related tail protein
MSGPKKADVKAQLNIAKRSQQQCANLISAAADAAIASILLEAEGIMKDIAAQEITMRDESGSFSSEALRIAPDAIRRAGEAVSSSSATIAESSDVLSRARSEVDLARQHEQDARRTFEMAVEEYNRAMKAINSASGHYMDQEMEWAQQATKLFAQAECELASAIPGRADDS